VELINEFTVAIPVERAWMLLTDLERIAPCMPGAVLEEVDGDEYRGMVKVKVGPMTAQYKGTASFRELDQPAYRAVLEAKGRDPRGQGTASATITAQLAEEATATRVTITTDLHLTGKVAQFGRGVLAEVSANLLDQFVASLEADVVGAEAAEPAPIAPDWAADSGAATPGDEAAGPTGVRRLPTREVEPVDLLQSAGKPVTKAVVPLVVGLVVLLLLVRRRRRRRAR
jgi:MYXO-CTERM domain-containing protein